MPKLRSTFPVKFPALSFLPALFLFLLMSACSSNGKKWNPDDYTVKSGDTVYSIAWRYELDPVEFARWNNIDTGSFLIRPGQRLHVRKPADFDSRKQTVSTSSSGSGKTTSKTSGGVKPGSGRRKTHKSLPGWVMVQRGDSLYAISKKYGVSMSRLAQLNQLKKPYVLQPGQTLFLKPLEEKGKKSTVSATSGQSTRKQPASTTKSAQSWAKTIHWQWPVKGKVLRRFNRNRLDAKGIDIGGSMGARVNAAAAGKVVYSGNGLISYGNLIIIKHNKHYLSAYAYNHKLLVQEGQWVKAGQQVAEMGRKGRQSPRLHFEIRKNGKPVNPQKYLP